ncbi:hypothetical protein B1F69_28995, partial [Pseudomonas syringae]
MFVLLGAAMGTLGGLFGIGGGLVAIPALGVLFGLDQQLAQGTALLMVLPNVLLALWRYNQRNRILLRNALMLIIPSFILAWLTALLAVRIDPQGMRLGFVGFLVVLTVFNVAQMYWRSKQATCGLGHEKRFWLLGGGSRGAGGLFCGGGGGVGTYMGEEGVDLLWDGTRPYAARVSHNAGRAARLAGIPCWALRRPAWQAGPGDDWREVADWS